MVTPPLLVLLCDASARTGLGHWVRSATVADELARRGWRIVALHAPDVETRVLDDGAGRGWTHLIRDRDPAIVHDALDDLDPSAVLIDTYRLGAGTIAGLHRPGRRTMLIDDLNDRGVLDADLVVNQNLGAERFDYRVTAATGLLLGPAYAMLRPQFAQLRPEGLRRLDEQPDGPSRVFVMMGGSDAAGALGAVLAGCTAAFPEARIRAVVPSGASAAAVEPLVRDGRIEAIAPTPHIAREMVAADLIVTAGGTSVWELCALGRPFGIVVVADNQRDTTRRLADIGASVQLAEHPVTPHELVGTLRTATGDPATLVARGRRAADLVDGRGCRRVADAVEAACQTTVTIAGHTAEDWGER